MLSDLPTDLLDLITRQLHYLDIANLRFTGCRMLNAKLLKGGVSQLTVQFSSKLVPFAWPNLFTRLTHLTHFTFDVSFSSLNQSIIEALLAPLSRTLRNLRIGCVDAFPALQHLLRQQPDSFQTLEELQLDCASTTHIPEDAAPLWPRFLASLISHHSFGIAPLLHLCSLPNSLTSLAGDFYDIRNTQLGTFPEALTSIRLSLQNLTCDPVPLLPAGLKSLNISTRLETNFGWTEGAGEKAAMCAWVGRLMAKLPRGLTFLHWPILGLYSRGSLESLPSALETWTGSYIKPHDWSLLPSSMTHFSMCDDIQRPLKKEVVQQIPRGMERLAVTASALPHVKSNSKNGVSVTVVTSIAGLKDEMTSLNMERLDSSITTLSYHCFLTPYLLEILPTHLVCLSVLNGLESDDMSLLPRTLKRLELMKSTLEEEQWKHLPPNLEHLTLALLPNQLSSSSSYWLPRTLRSFEANPSYAQKVLPVEWFEGLPPNLCSLILAVSWNSFSSAPCLPPSLTYLYLFFSNSKSEIAEELHHVLTSLPPLLTSLHIISDNTLSYQTSSLEKLPKRLTRFTLPPALNGPSIAHLLPRSLISFNWDLF